MSIKVTKTTNSFSVKLKTPDNYKIQTTSGGIQVPAQFSDLQDFDASGVQNNYLVMYNATTQKYITVDPDAVLSAAASGNTFPDDFLDRLDADLDNRIDLDAGTF